MRPKICLLGATGNVAKGIIASVAEGHQAELVLASRSTKKVKEFLNEQGYSFEVIELKEAASKQFDIILNGAGVCDPAVINQNPSLLFDSHREVDDLVMENLRQFNETLFFNISSGAVYGADFTEPAPKEIKLEVPEYLNEISGDAATMYSKTKLFFERKHRALSKFNIVDVRLFSTFHRHLDLSGHYFLAQLVRCLKEKTTFQTSTQDLVKDYVHPSDLVNLAILLWEKGGSNFAIDLSSNAPVKKSELIEFFTAKYHLKVEYKEMEFQGTKVNYYSSSKEAQELGFRPFGTSLDCIEKEMRHILL